MNIITETIRIDSNPLNARRIQSILKGQNRPGEDFQKMINDVLKDTTFNILDLPMWIVAFESIACALKSATPESGIQVYEVLKRTMDIKTIEFRKGETEDA